MNTDKTIAAEPTGRGGLPAGMVDLSARLTNGTWFGWKSERDSVPELVQQLYDRHGAYGLVGTARLLMDLDGENGGLLERRVAERIVRWAPGHYQGRYTAQGYDAGRDATGEAAKALYATVLRGKLSGWSDSIDWAQAVDWPRAAHLLSKAGRYRFVVHKKRIDEVRDPDTRVITQHRGLLAEVDVFSLWDGTWDGDA